MAGERILYICFDPALLLLRERVLIALGFDVYTILGRDGLIGTREINDYDFILVGDEGSLKERQGSVERIRNEEPSPPPIIALCRGVEDVLGADYRISTAEPRNWFDAVSDCIRSYRKLA